MTGGLVAVLGETGKNFAAGMSGGVAYVYDPDGDFEARANTEMVSLSRNLDDVDERALRRLIENQFAYTESDRARKLLADWDRVLSSFVRVMPDAYARVLEEGADDAREDLPPRAEAVRAGDGPDADVVASGDD
jgi:glutamate synthase (NADPH/NADH) large chain